MRFHFRLFLLLITLSLLVGCTTSSGSSSGSNPAAGMQVATLAGTAVKGSLTLPTPNYPTPVPIPTRTYTGTILFQDDFSSESSGWEINSSEYGYTAYEQGGYVVEALIAKEYNWGAAYKDYSDIRIDADVVVLQAPASLNDAYGVDCRLQSNGDSYGFRISSDGYIAIELFSNEEASMLADWTINPAVLTDGSPNHLTAFCVGNSFSFYVNDVLVAQATDDTFSHGDIALSAISFDSDPVKVLFDNVVVQQASESDIPESQT